MDHLYWNGSFPNKLAFWLSIAGFLNLNLKLYYDSSVAEKSQKYSQLFIKGYDSLKYRDRDSLEPKNMQEKLAPNHSMGQNTGQAAWKWMQEEGKRYI